MLLTIKFANMEELTFSAAPNGYFVSQPLTAGDSKAISLHINCEEQDAFVIIDRTIDPVLGWVAATRAIPFNEGKFDATISNVEEGVHVRARVNFKPAVGKFVTD